MTNLWTDFLVKCTNINKFINKFYRKQHVLKNVSLTVQKEDRIGVVGPNGTGKNNSTWNFIPITSFFQWHQWKTSWNSDWGAIARI